MKKVCEEAALHFASGALKSQDVPVGIHDLSRVQVVITFPDGAAVQRAPGSEGDGREVIGPPQSVSVAAALLFIQKSGIEGPSTFGLWKSCIQEANERGLKAGDVMPHEANMALKELHSEMQVDCKSTKATSATRVGVANSEIKIERLTIQDHVKHVTRRMVRRA